MQSVPRRTPGGQVVLRALAEALHRNGLDVDIYSREGTWYVHVSPPNAPTAGTEIRMSWAGGDPCFFSEWGAAIGWQANIVASRVSRWFGRPSTRP